MIGLFYETFLKTAFLQIIERLMNYMQYPYVYIRGDLVGKSLSLSRILSLFVPIERIIIHLFAVKNA